MDKDVSDIFWDEYGVYKSEYERIAKISTAPSTDHYTEAELSDLGSFRTIEEGGAVQFDSPIEGNQKTIYYVTYGLGFQVTQNALQDDPTGHFKNQSKMLAKSAQRKVETVYWNIFNNAFASETAADGQYICDTDHSTLKSKTTIKNEPATNGALSTTTLQAAFEYYWGVSPGLVSEAGAYIDMEPWLLVIPTALRWTAIELLKTEGKVDSFDHNINTVNPSDNPDLPGWNIHCSRYLTSSTAWFLIAKEHDMRLMWKRKTSLESADDFHTGSALFKATNRFACACFQYKGIYGNAGA